MTNQTNGFEKNLKKDMLLKNLQILLWGILTLVLAILTLVECIPSSGSGVEVKETIDVSSSLISVSGQNYVSAISGILFNPTDDTVTVEKMVVTVSDGKVEKEVEIEGFAIAPRFTQEIYTRWEGMEEYDRVTGVQITVDGRVDVLTNIGASSTVSGLAIFYLILLIPTVFLLVRAAKGRYYLYQESKM